MPATQILFGKPLQSASNEVPGADGFLVRHPSIFGDRVSGDDFAQAVLAESYESQCVRWEWSQRPSSPFFEPEPLPE